MSGDPSHLHTLLKFDFGDRDLDGDKASRNTSSWTRPQIQSWGRPNKIQIENKKAPNIDKIA